METPSLPPSVIKFIEYLARMARGYDNHLKWNEQAKFKADLMNVRHRWTGVETTAFRERCLAEGMRGEDVDELADWLGKAKTGRRLVPQHSYRDYSFPEPAEAAAPSQVETSRDW
ncbi:hypothetical protein [Arthrobacter sp. D2-10]